MHPNPYLERGKSDSASNLSRVVGYETKFQDYDFDNDGIKRTNHLVCARLVKNSSGGTLSAKQSVLWKSGTDRTEVSGVTDGADKEVAGVVDEWHTGSTIADGAYFWLVRHGPSKVIAHGAFSEDDPLVSQASGRADTLDNAIAEAGNSDSGAVELVNAKRVLHSFAAAMEAASSQDDEKLAFVDCRF